MNNSALLFEHSPLAKQIIGRDGKTVHVNEAWEKLWGVPFAALSGYNMLEDKQLIDSGIVPKLKRVFEGESFTLAEMEYDREGTPEVTGSSGKLWVRTHAYPIMNENGLIEEIVLLQEDTSENHFYQERIRLYQEIFSLSNDGIAIIDPDGIYIEQNNAHKMLLGYSDEELAGKTPAIHFGKEAFSAVAKEMAETGHYSGELISHTKSGEEKLLHLSAFTVKNVDGSVRCYVGIKRDLTRQKLDEKALRKSEEKYRGIFDESVAAIYVFDQEKHFIDSNQAGLDMLGYTREELLSMSIPDVDADKGSVQPAHRHLLSGGRLVNFEHRLVRKSGEVITVLNNSRALTNEQGEVIGMQSTLLDITEFKQADEALRASEERFDLAMRASNDGLWDWNIRTHAVYFSPRWKSMLGYRNEELEDSFAVWEKLTDDEGRARTMALIGACIKGQTEGFTTEFLMRHKDGYWVDILARATLIRDENGEAVRMVGTHVDISDLKRTEDSLRTREAELKEAQRIGHLGSWYMDLATNEVCWSEELYKMYGFDPALPPPLYTESMKLFPPDSWERLSSAISRAVEKGISYELELEMISKDGKRKWMLARGELVRDAHGQPARVQGVVMDISERKKFEEMIWRQANFDTLTGLPNRRLFHERLEQEAKKALRSGQQMALLLIDLDYFKELNDTRGHDVGDLLLIEVSKRISGCVRTSDTVARLGGDEFIVILPDLDDLYSIERVAQKIIERLSDSFLIKDEAAFITASIGISLYPDDTEHLDNLFKNADQAMYAAKGEGRNRYSYFTPELHETARKRSALSNDLRSALENNQFKLYYQPIVDLATGDLYKAEALIRWYHPERGVVSPMDFIPIAEENGSIVPIGDWVFKQAVAQAQRWQQEFHPSFQISVNKSPVQILHENCILWTNHLTQQGLSGNSITVEITEGVLLNSKLRANDSLLVLREAGIQIAVDDFGTGYSSLAYLKEFDIDYLKIDKSFVMNLGEGTSDLALCEAIIVMAHRLGLKVIAEGVETEKQRDILIAAECDFAQGYFYSKPVLPEEFEKLLTRKR